MSDADEVIEIKSRLVEMSQKIYEVKQQLRADESSGFARGDDWRFRANQVLSFTRSEMRPLRIRLDEIIGPAIETKRNARRELAAKAAGAGKKARSAKVFRKIAKEILDPETYAQICYQATKRMDEADDEAME